MEQKTPSEWLKDERFGYCILVLDPDGWDRKNFAEDWARPLTEEEMHGKVMMSTIEYDSTWTKKRSMISCVRVLPIGDGGGGYIQPISDALDMSWLFDGAEDGDTYTMKLIQMPQKELDALPEFDGF